MKTNVTEASIKKAKYAELVQLCKKQGIEFQNQPREKLISLLLSKLGSLEGEIPEAETVEQGEPAKGKKADKKVEQTTKATKKKAVPEKKGKTEVKKGETKSCKILALHAKGKKVREIHKLLNAHPSFIYTVLAKNKVAPNK